MKVSEEYYEDEVREGYFVPTRMKQAWAAQIKVFEEVRKICEDHNITYYADWGTMLGAVRHHGFIPWDDDFDICMKRKDYERFVRIAPALLPKEYKVVNMHNNIEYMNFLTRVINGNVITSEGDKLEENCGSPYVVGLDVFPLDYLPTDPAEEAEFKVMIEDLYKLCRVALDLQTDDPDYERIKKHILDSLKILSGIEIEPDITIEKLRNRIYCLIDYMMSIYSDDEEAAKEITSISHWFESNGKYRMPKEYYDSYINLPFENSYIAVPAKFHQMLSGKYGDYLRPVRAGGAHDYPCYEHQDELLKMMRDNFFEEYCYQEEDIEPVERSLGKNRKERCQEHLKLLGKIHTLVKKLAEVEERGTIVEMLVKCQETALQMGTIVEEEPDDGEAMIRCLEQYCEEIYHLAEQNQKGKGIQDHLCVLDEYEQELERLLQNEIREKKEILFLPYKGKHWDGFDSVWRELNREDNVRTYVVPVPYYTKLAGKIISEEHLELTGYPEEVEILSYKEFAFDKHKWDEIYIQVPYDNCHERIMIHPFFHSKHLRTMTKRLTYIPYFFVDEFEESDDKAYHMMKHYVYMPGVVFADRTITQSEKIRQHYIEKLCKLSGDDKRSYWEQKISGAGSPIVAHFWEKELEVSHLPEAWKNKIYKADGSMKKVICYQINDIILFGRAKEIVDKIEDTLRVFDAAQDEVTLLWVQDMHMRDTLEIFHPDVMKKYDRLVRQYCDSGWGIYDTTKDWKRQLTISDAYYGDQSKLVHWFIQMQKPVMIQDVEVRSNN